MEHSDENMYIGIGAYQVKRWHMYLITYSHAAIL